MKRSLLACVVWSLVAQAQTQPWWKEKRCTPFDLVDAGLVDGRLPDGGLSPDSSACCASGIECPHECSQVGSPVDILNGFAWLDRTDIDIHQPWGPAVRFARHYLTAAAELNASTTLGPGWSHTYSTHLELSGASPAEYARLFMGESTGEEYLRIGNAYSTIRAGRHLVWDDATRMYVAHRSDGAMLVFDEAGTLRVMRSHDGGEAHLRYQGDDASCAALPLRALCRVDFLFGRQLWFAYYPSGLLKSVALDAQATSLVASYDYDTHGELKTAVAADGHGETYTYGFRHVSWVAGVEVDMLTQATDADGTLVESFGYAFNHTSADGPARVISHHTPTEDYTFAWEYLDLNTLQVVRKTKVRGNKENLDITFRNNDIESKCFLDSRGNCDTTRLHTYVNAPGLRELQCLREGSGRYLRLERDSVGRVSARADGLETCDSPATGSPRVELFDYLGDSSVQTSRAQKSLDSSAPSGFVTFSLDDYTVPASAINATCGTPACETPRAYNAPPLTTRPQRQVSMGRTYVDENGTWGTQVRVTRYDFDTLGRLKAVDGPRAGASDTTTFSWSSTVDWRLDAVTRAGVGPLVLDDYDVRGHARLVTDATGSTRTFSFDAVGRLTQLLQPGETAPSTWDYLDSGRLSVATSPSGALSRFTYDTNGEVDTVTRLSSAGSSQPDAVTQYSRTLKRVTQLTQSEAHPQLSPVRQSGFAYDSQGRMTTRLSPGPTHGEARGVDDDGRDVWLSDPGRFEANATVPSQSHHFGYDVFGRLTDVEQRMHGQWVATAKFTWDIHDNLASYTDAKGVTTRYQHDDFGRLVEVSSPDFGVRRFVYDEADNVVKERRADGVVLSFEYDAANRLTRVTQLGAQLEQWDWAAEAPGVQDCVGRVELPAPLGGGAVTHVRDAAGDWYFGYTPKGALAYEALVARGETCAKTLWWEYDGAGLLTAMVYPSGARLEYGYPPVGAALHERPSSVTLVTEGNRQVLASGLAWVQGEVVAYSTPAGRWSLSRGLDGTPAVIDVVGGGTRGQSFADFDGWGNPGRDEQTISQQTTSAQRATFHHDDMPALTSARGPGYGSHGYDFLASGDRKSADGAAYCYAPGTHRLALVSGKSRFSYTLSGEVTQQVNADGTASTWCYGSRGEVTRDVGSGGEVHEIITNFRRQRVSEVWPLNGLHEDFRVDAASRLLVEAGVASLKAQYPRPLREYVWLGAHPLAVVESTEAATGAVTRQGVMYVFSGQFGEVLAEAQADGGVTRQYEYSPFGERVDLGQASQTSSVAVTVTTVPGFDNLWGTVKVSGARALKLKWSDASWQGCHVTLRTQSGFTWLAEYATLSVGMETDWLPSNQIALEVQGCTTPTSWKPVVEVSSQSGAFSQTTRTEVTESPYPSSGQHFSLSFATPTHVVVEKVALASCDSLEARNAAGVTLWRWKPSGYSASGFVVPDTKAIMPPLQGVVDVGVWGAGCNSLERKSGFALTKTLEAPAVSSTRPVSIGLPGQKFRHDGTADNWYRLYSPALGRYMAPEPLVQSPGFVVRQAQQGLVLTYVYAANNPLRYVDPDGLRIRLMDAAAVSAAFGLNQTPRGAELYRWLDESPLTYDVYGDAANFDQELPRDVYGRYTPGTAENQCSIGGGRVLVDANKARANGLTPARVFGHELTHAGLHDQQVRNMPFVPDAIYRYTSDSRPGGGLPGDQSSNGPHRAMDWYWIFSFGGL